MVRPCGYKYYFLDNIVLFQLEGGYIFFVISPSGYFKAPGMEKLDTPYDDLFRGGPGKMDDWDDVPPLMKNDRRFKIPQMNYYHNRGIEDTDFNEPVQLWYEPILKPMLNQYALGRITSTDGFHSDLPLSGMSSLMRQPVGESERTSGGEQRVVGGRDVSDGEIPWQVRFEFIQELFYIILILPDLKR